MNVYLMSPVTTYGTRYYKRMLKKTRSHFRRANIFVPSKLFASSADWRSKWPSLALTVDVGVMFGEKGSGTVGFGVSHEIDTLRDLHSPVFWLQEDGTLTTAFQLEVINEGEDWQNYARIRPASERSDLV